ncbi:MAG: hypothetical protein G01um10145_814 [Microgenomates group bacterium Gr01-1014_5]|nr:MAG: hypothetical protein G01um10145_814 [Microgenomates group bacterium Gr01-1014_5]
MINSSYKQTALINKTKLVFGKKYGREISNQEAEEIMQNLLAFMETVVKKEYN